LNTVQNPLLVGGDRQPGVGGRPLFSEHLRGPARFELEELDGVFLPTGTPSLLGEVELERVRAVGVADPDVPRSAAVKATNAPQTDELLKDTYRQGWELPI